MKIKDKEEKDGREEMVSHCGTIVTSTLSKRYETPDKIIQFVVRRLAIELIY